MNRPIRLARVALEPPGEIEQPDAYAFGTEVGPNYQLCNGRLPPQKPLNLPKPVVYSACLYAWTVYNRVASGIGPSVPARWELYAIILP